MPSCTSRLKKEKQACTSISSPLLTVAAHAAWLACVGRIALIYASVCPRGFLALVSDCLCMPQHHVSLQHTHKPAIANVVRYCLYTQQNMPRLIDKHTNRQNNIPTPQGRGYPKAPSKEGALRPDPPRLGAIRDWKRHRSLRRQQTSPSSAMSTSAFPEGRPSSLRRVMLRFAAPTLSLIHI